MILLATARDQRCRKRCTKNKRDAPGCQVSHPKPPSNQQVLDEVPEVAQEKRKDLVALSDALCALATIDPRMSQVVELRFLVDSASKRRRRF